MIHTLEGQSGCCENSQLEATGTANSEDGTLVSCLHMACSWRMGSVVLMKHLSIVGIVASFLLEVPQTLLQTPVFPAEGEIHQ